MRRHRIAVPLIRPPRLGRTFVEVIPPLDATCLSHTTVDRLGKPVAAELGRAIGPYPIVPLLRLWRHSSTRETSLSSRNRTQSCRHDQSNHRSCRGNRLWSVSSSHTCQRSSVETRMDSTRVPFLQTRIVEGRKESKAMVDEPSRCGNICPWWCRRQSCLSW